MTGTAGPGPRVGVEKTERRDEAEAEVIVVLVVLAVVAVEGFTIEGNVSRLSPSGEHAVSLGGRQV